MSNDNFSLSPFNRPPPRSDELSRRKQTQVVGKGPAWNRQKEQLKQSPELQKFINSSVPPGSAPPSRIPLNAPHMVRPAGSAPLPANRKLPPLPGKTPSTPLSSVPARPVNAPLRPVLPRPPITAQPATPNPTTSTALRSRGLPPTPAQPVNKNPLVPQRVVTQQNPPSNIPPKQALFSAGNTPLLPKRPLGPRPLPSRPPVANQPPPRQGVASAKPAVLKPPVQRTAPKIDQIMQSNYSTDILFVTPSSDAYAHKRDSQILGFLSTNVNFQKQMKSTGQALEKLTKLNASQQNKLLTAFNVGQDCNLQSVDIENFEKKVVQLEKTLSAFNQDLLEVLNKQKVTVDAYMTDETAIALLAVFSKHSHALFEQVSSIAHHPHYLDMQKFLNDPAVAKVLGQNVSSFFIQVTSAPARYQSLFEPITEKMKDLNAQSKAKVHLDGLKQKLSKLDQALKDPRFNLRALSSNKEYSRQDLADIRKFLFDYKSSNQVQALDSTFAPRLLSQLVRKGIGPLVIVKGQTEQYALKYLVSLHNYYVDMEKQHPGLLPKAQLNELNKQIKKELLILEKQIEKNTKSIVKAHYKQEYQQLKNILGKPITS